MLEILSKPINIENGDKILLAVSGGPDSMALLDIARRQSEEEAFDFAVAHINHSLRKQADIEEKAIEDYCKTFDIPFYSKKVDLNEDLYKNLTLEEAGREARYTFFDELASKYDFNKLLTAHHLNDQAETVLMRLIRGSGPEGLIGIKEESKLNNLQILRPFLNYSKDDLKEYCVKNSVKYFEDQSNKDNQYTRNFIRNKIIPELEENNIKAQENIVRSMDLVKEQNDFYNEIIENIASEWVSEDGVGVNIKAEVFTNLDKLLENSNFSFLSEKAKQILKKEVIRKAIRRLGKSKDVSKKNIEKILEFFESDSNGSINLPHDLLAIKNSGQFEILINGEKPTMFGEFPLPVLEENQVFFYPKNRTTLKIEHGIASEFNDIEKSQEDVILKSLKNIEGLTLRNRKTGDYVALKNTNFHKKLSRFMIDKKVPRFLRDSIPILALGDKIIWIPGYYIHKDFIVKNPVEEVTMLSLKSF